MPIGVGLFLRALRTEEDPLLGAEGVAALLMVGTICGILMALFLNNAGGAWDNAKKYIETGAHGGKYLTGADGAKTKNPTHGAAVVGDTVGDPFKDTAGPSLHVLIKCYRPSPSSSRLFSSEARASRGERGTHCRPRSRMHYRRSATAGCAACLEHGHFCAASTTPVGASSRTYRSLKRAPTAGSKDRTPIPTPCAST